MELIKTNIPGLMKDKKSKLIINTDENDYNRAKLTRKQHAEFNTLKTDVELIKKQLQMIIEKLNE